MQCDMCGKGEKLFKTLIEGVEMDVCENCTKLGAKLGPLHKIDRPVIVRSKRTQRTRNISEEFLVDDFGGIVKKGREKLGIKQEDLAKKIAEKESLIHNIESGHFSPSIKLAKKLEKFLGIKIVNVVTEGKFEQQINIEDRGLTLGDLMDKK